MIDQPAPAVVDVGTLEEGGACGADLDIEGHPGRVLGELEALTPHRFDDGQAQRPDLQHIHARAQRARGAHGPLLPAYHRAGEAVHDVRVGIQAQAEEAEAPLGEEAEVVAVVEMRV